MTKEIEIKLLGGLKNFTEENTKTQYIKFEEEKDLTIKDLIKELNLPTHEVSLYLLNGKEANLNTPIEDGDKVKLLPVVGGGV